MATALNFCACQKILTYTQCVFREEVLYKGKTNDSSGKLEVLCGEKKIFSEFLDHDTLSDLSQCNGLFL